MNKISFASKVDKYKEKRIKQLNKRELKIIAETVKIIILKNSKRLTQNDYNNICLAVYGKTDSSKYIGIYRMVNDIVVKDKINDSLVQYYLSKGINVRDKIIELSDKSEELIKSTSDALSLLKYYKELDDNNGVRIKETRTYDSFDTFKSNTPTEIKQEVIGNINTDGNSNRNDIPIGHKDGGMGEGESDE